MRVRAGDVRLFFDVDGAKLVPDGPWMRERPTIVLVHPGPGFDHALFKVFIGPELARAAQVVYFDLGGHGRSDPRPPERMNLDVWAEDLKNLCDALRIERPIVLGHGHGALVAGTYAARYPEHPSKLVFSAPYARLVPSRCVEVFDRLAGAEAGEAALQFYTEPNERTFTEYLRLCFPQVVRYDQVGEVVSRALWSPETMIDWTATEGQTFDLRADLGRIRAPSLVLAGEDDPYAPLASAQEFADALPRGLVRFVSYPETRHSLFRDMPPAVDEVIRFALDRSEAA